MVSQELLKVIKQVEKFYPQWDGEVRGIDRADITFTADDGTGIWMHTAVEPSAVDGREIRKSFIEIKHIHRDQQPREEIFYRTEWREGVAPKGTPPFEFVQDAESCTYLANYIMRIAGGIEEEKKNEKVARSQNIKDQFWNR